eukprot:TRINITY_DN157_c0_g4_i1.p2 TRINITY_DN157_c0_g4~~TRINITY_DN157_c0_g4_i1.p2  ORF type:complete len:649 (+),score=346.62 TRINITY_DN157_c0_g4_i1:49-1995(+)
MGEPVVGTPILPPAKGKGTAFADNPDVELMAMPAAAGDEDAASLDTAAREARDAEHEEHKLNLMQACAANLMNMFGTGPFITIPFVIAETKPAGPHAMLGYLLAGTICVCDSFTWAELGSMMPYSGGSYVYLRECFGSEGLGRMMSFLFLFQFLFSGPLEVSSGYVAMAQYLSYIDGQNTFLHHAGLGTIFSIISVGFLYNDIKDVGTFLEVLGLVTCLAIAFTIVAGFVAMDTENYKAPDDAYDHPWLLFYGLWGAARIGVYDFTGYYDANQMGDEVQNPRYIIPRAGVTTACVVTVIFFLVYLAVIGVVPWDGPDGVVQAVEDETAQSQYIMASFAEEIGGKIFAYFVCLLVVVVIFGACFAQLLGFSQIPYSAAKSGYFYAWFAHEHPTKLGVADHSLLAVGLVTTIGCWLPIEILISAMVTSLVLCQFFLQSIGVFVYRLQHPEVERPFQVPLYPLPLVYSSLGFFMIWITSPSYLLYGNTEEPLIEFSLLVVVLGIGGYFIWAHGRGYWPFEARLVDECEEEEEEERVWEDEHDAKYSPRPAVADTGANMNVMRAGESRAGSREVTPRPLAPGLVEDETKRSPRMWLGGWREAKMSPRPTNAGHAVGDSPRSHASSRRDHGRYSPEVVAADAMPMQMAGVRVE